MKLFTNKKLVIITATVLLLAVAVGTTLAFVFTNTDPVENTFTPSKVACAVVENNGTPVTGDVVDTGTKKTNVQIKNTGDTDAYIRVAVVVSWKNAKGNVYARTPIAGTDYTITYNLSEDGWVDGKDGFYYYSQAVSPTSPNNLTEILISNAALESGVTGPVGTDNTQYYLSIEIVASAIQANGMGATSAQDAWVKAVETTGN